MEAAVHKSSVSVLGAAKAIVSAVLGVFTVLSAAAAVAGAVENRRQPSAEDLRALDLADLKFNYRS